MSETRIILPIQISEYNDAIKFIASESPHPTQADMLSKLKKARMRRVQYLADH